MKVEEVPREISDLAVIRVLEDVCLGRRTGVEENIKIKVVVRFLKALGYDEIRDMDFEHHVGNKKADIALLVRGKPKVIVETKSLEKTLEDHKVQALSYARKKGIEWVLLTNGNDFQIYKSFMPGVEDRRNRPIFETAINELPIAFATLNNLIGKSNIQEIEKVAEPYVEAVRKAITEEELLETLEESKTALFHDLREQFNEKYTHDTGFRKKIDDWLETHRIDTDVAWIDLYKKDKNFRDLVNRILELKSNIDSRWIEGYERNKRFRSQTDKRLRDNDIQVNWIDKLCAEGAFAFINRILFLRICEDRGFIPEQTTKGWIEMMQKAFHKEKVTALLQALFGDITNRFKGIYAVPLFDHILLEDLEWNKEAIVNLITRTKKHNFKKITRDIIGDVYQHHISRETRRQLGQFYTPEPLVEHILDNVPLSPKTKILDPACGSGGFLMSIYDRLRRDLVASGKEESEIHEYLLKRVLFGIDIDSFAVQLTLMNLLLKDLDHPTAILNIAVGNSLLVTLDAYSNDETAFEGVTDVAVPTPSDIFRQRPFGLIVGNPPYVNIPRRDPEFRSEFSRYYSDILKGPVNSASLFVKRCIDLMGEGGWLGFVLPKSLLRVDSYSGIRRFILDSCEVSLVTDVGRGFPEVGFEVVVMILKKTKSASRRRNNKIRVVTDVVDLERGRFKSHEIRQDLFQQTGTFSIYLDSTFLPIVTKLNRDSVNLGAISDIWRGIGLSINSSLVSSTRQTPKDQKLLHGEAIGRYQTKYHKYLKASDARLERFEKALQRLQERKIVVQNIVTSKVRSVATYDNEACPNIDTITNVLVTDERFVDKYVLAIMNSRLMTFYLRDIVFNRAELTMHMDKPYLGQLPIKETPLKMQRRFAREVDEILELKMELATMKYALETAADYIPLQRRLAETDSKLNKMVYDLYGLTEKEKELIDSITY